MNHQIEPYQHCCSEVKLLLELRDKYVYGDQVFDVFLLHFPDNVGQPFKLFLSPSHPQEIHLQSYWYGIQLYKEGSCLMCISNSFSIQISE